MKQATFIQLVEKSNKQLVFDVPGSYVVFFHNVSGDVTFNITTSHVHLSIFGLYTGGKNESFTLHTTQTHAAPDSYSSLLIKGLFDDKSSFIYQGLIRIEKKAHGSHAYQKNQNILLSPHVFVTSKPDLEILANDVYCTHGSTTGSFNNEDLFYTYTRGLSTIQARKLLISGFLQEIFDTISAKGLTVVSERIKNTLLHG